MYDPLTRAMDQAVASQTYIAVVFAVLLVIFGLVCIFCPKVIWELIRIRLGVKEEGPPSRRARWAVRVMGAVWIGVAVFLLYSAF